MGLDSDAGFLQGFLLPPPFYNHGGAPFWRGSQVVLPAIPGGSGAAIGGGGGRVNPAATASRNEPLSILPKGSSPGNIVADSAPSHNLDNNKVVNWSREEQALLKQGLVRRENNLSGESQKEIIPQKMSKIGRYRILIGNSLLEKKVDCSALMNVNLASPRNFPTHHPILHDINQSIKFSNQVSAIDGLTDHLLAENARIFTQVDADIASWKLQDNIDLIVRANNNISAILYSMSELPGMMRRMPPLPVSVDDVLVHSMLHNYIVL